MSLLLGQSGSLERDDFVQPPYQSQGPNIVAKGSYLQPGPYASVSIDDRSRFRNTSFVPPVSIELMQGFLTYASYTPNPNGADANTMPRTTFIAQEKPQQHYAYNLTPSNFAAAKALQGAGGQPTVQLSPYGQVTGGPVSSSFCPPALGYINASGACAVPPSSPLYQPDARNVYF